MGGTGERTAWWRLRTAATAAGVVALGWWLTASQPSVVQLWKDAGGVPSRPAPQAPFPWEQDLPLEGFSPLVAAGGALILVVAFLIVVNAALPATGRAPGPDGEAPVTVARSMYDSRLEWLPWLGAAGLGSTLLLAYGAGWVWAYQPERSARVLSLTPLGYALAGVAAAGTLGVVKVLFDRVSVVGRRDVEWARWANSLGRVGALLAVEHRTRLEHPGTTLPLGYGINWQGPERIGSTHALHHGYGLITGHPMGIPLSLGLMAAKAAVNQGLKRAYTGPTRDEVHRATLAAAEKRLYEVLDDLDRLSEQKLSRRDEQRRQRNRFRTEDLLQAVLTA